MYYTFVMNQRLALTSWSFFILSCSQTSENYQYSQSAIIGGSVARATEFPATGAIIARSGGQGPNFGTLICTASLIAPDTLLTAAHCTINPFEGFINFTYFFTLSNDVSGFENDPTNLPPDTVGISKLVPHPDFDINSMASPMGLGNFYDIGLAFLESEITSVSPLVIMQTDDSSSVLVNAEVDIAGYGLIAPNGQSAGVKHVAQTVINEVAPAEIQIGNMAPTPQKCRGDSGGPTILEVNDGLFPSTRLISVTSRAYDQRDCEVGGVDTRVDFFREWVSNEMTKACSEGFRLSCSNGGAPAEPTMEGMPSPLDAGASDSGQQDLEDSAQATDSGTINPPDAGFMGLDAQTSTPTASNPDQSSRPRRVTRADDGSCGCQSTHLRNEKSAYCIAFLLVILFWRRRLASPV